MATLQVKNLDDRLYQAPGARAAMDNRSTSQEVVTLIRQFLAQRPTDPREATIQLPELAGSWDDERSAEHIASDLREARRSRRPAGENTDAFA